MVKNITLSAEEKIIEKARNHATRAHTSLNVAFRDWLFRYAQSYQRANSYKDLMGQLDTVDAGRHFSRDEINER